MTHKDRFAAAQILNQLFSVPLSQRALIERLVVLGSSSAHYILNESVFYFKRKPQNAKRKTSLVKIKQKNECI